MCCWHGDLNISSFTFVHVRHLVQLLQYVTTFRKFDYLHEGFHFSTISRPVSRLSYIYNTDDEADGTIMLNSERRKPSQFSRTKTCVTNLVLEWKILKTLK